jgi:chorismate-pyruvate lyase
MKRDPRSPATSGRMVSGETALWFWADGVAEPRAVETVVAANVPADRGIFPRAAQADPLLRLLTAHDGSTTRLCEAVAGGPVAVQLLGQRVTQEVPAQVRQLLGADRYIERMTSLLAHGQVLTDNLVYVALDTLAPRLRSELEHGRRPIGHLLASDWTRREAVTVEPPVLQRLWRRVGLPDPRGMRCYRLRTLDGAAMLVCEVFRRGMLMQAPARAAQAVPRHALAALAS